MATVTETRQTNLRILADMYEDLVKVKNACANRLRAVDQGRDEAPVSEDVANSRLLDRLAEALEEVQLQMEKALPEHPVYEWLMGVPGINRTIAGRVLGMIPMESEEDFPTFSKLRVFAGLCPGRNRLVKGKKAEYCKRLKTSLYLAFSNLLKAEPLCRRSKNGNGPRHFYPEIYQRWRLIYKERHGEGPPAKEAGWPDLRQHYAAKNKLLDVFVCHIWQVWRERCGWSVRSLYVHEMLGHESRYEPADFSSPAMAKKKMRQHR